MAMTTIYLMRHGHVDNPDNVFYGPEFPLSEFGKKQIAEVSHDMQAAGVKPCAVYASPFRRAQETAAIAAASLGVDEIKTDIRIREWDVGSWFDHPLREFHAATGYEADPPPERLPGGVEPLAEMAARVVEVIREAVVECAGKEVIVVSHREPLVTAIFLLRGENFSMVHHVPFERGMVWKAVFDEGGNFIEVGLAFDRSSAADRY